MGLSDFLSHKEREGIIFKGGKGSHIKIESIPGLKRTPTIRTNEKGLFSDIDGNASRRPGEPVLAPRKDGGRIMKMPYEAPIWWAKSTIQRKKASVGVSALGELAKGLKHFPRELLFITRVRACLRKRVANPRKRACPRVVCPEPKRVK